MPPVLDLFLYDSITRAVDATGDKGVVGHHQQRRRDRLVDRRSRRLRGAAGFRAGGASSSAPAPSTSEMVEAVGEQGAPRSDIEGALETCNARKGSTAAVVAAALRDIVERERESSSTTSSTSRSCTRALISSASAR
ncbi:MAG: hypothetical protein U5K33_07955 [Halofilum sp. (in: g-proteobacteria)]|nr:hypothetical protein [Halofilum sp. (in: g-proteobacteria)]